MILKDLSKATNCLAIFEPFGSGQESASRFNILSPRGSDSGNHTFLVQDVPEIFHRFVIRSLQIRPGNSMKTDKIDFGFQSVD